MNTCLPPPVPPPPCALRSVGLGNTAITGLIQTLLTVYCEIATHYMWPQDSGENYVKKGRETFDFIVVGAGTAGSVIAGRLSENPNYRVLLIEAGDDPPTESIIPGLSAGVVGTKSDWADNTTSNGMSCRGNPGGSCNWVQGRTLGGGSAINFMFAIRGNRRDFDSWEAMGNPTWGYDSVLPYFKKTEDYRGPNPYGIHGVGGPLVVTRTMSLPSVSKLLLDAGAQSGYGVVDEFRDGHFLGFGPIDLTTKDHLRNTPATAFLIEPRPNLHIIKNAVVKKIEFDEGKRARSVLFEYTTKDKKVHQLEAFNTKEIIVSAGAVRSPKLLQLSGIGPSKLLKEHKIPVLCDMPVGENLQDHASINIFFKLNANDNSNRTDTTFNYFINRNESFETMSVVNVASFLDIGNESGKYPNIQVHYQWYPKGSETADFIRITPAVTQKLSETLKTSGVLMLALLMLNPKSRGSVRIKSSNFRDKPIIEPNYLGNPEDVKLFIKAIRAFNQLQNTPAFKENKVTAIEIPTPGCEHLEKDSDEYWECYIRYNSNTIFHPTSTVKMGPLHDPQAIVDPTLKVKCVSRLRVADASIMPIITSANPMLSTIMIGEKAADFIKEEWNNII